MEKTRKNEGAKRTKDVKCNSVVWHDLSQRECVGSDQVHTTRLKTRKQMCRSATVSSLCTIQHSPSAWAGFAPKLTETLIVAVTKSCSQIPRSASVPLNNKTLSCKSLQVPSSHFAMLWKDLSWSRATEAFSADCDDVSVNELACALPD